MRHIFIILCGISPAAITQTLYQLYLNEPEAIPDEVIVITTPEGQEAIKKKLFDTGLWERFKTDLIIAPDKLQFADNSRSISFLPSEEAKQQTTDYIFSFLRQFTEDHNSKITLAVDSGDNGIAAICALNISLLGRRQDTLCYVRVNAPFDNPGLTPEFYYPDNREYCLPDGITVNSDKAVITLAEIPFARCRYLFNDQADQLAGTFMDSVDKINGKIAENLDAPELYIKPDTLQCFIDEIEITFSVAELTIYWLLALRCKNSCLPVTDHDELFNEFHAFAETINSTVMPGIIHYDYCKDKNVADLLRIISVISTKIKTAVAIEQGRNFCLPASDRGIYGLLLPPDNIICPRNY